jgi:hypothetical protein
MLLCKQTHCIWYLVYIKQASGNGIVIQEEPSMSHTASSTIAPSSGFFSRLMASVDRLLMAWHHISTRNGDVPRFGL